MPVRLHTSGQTMCFAVPPAFLGRTPVPLAPTGAASGGRATLLAANGKPLRTQGAVVLLAWDDACLSVANCHFFQAAFDTPCRLFGTGGAAPAQGLPARCGFGGGRPRARASLYRGARKPDGDVHERCTRYGGHRCYGPRARLREARASTKALARCPLPLRQAPDSTRQSWPRREHSCRRRGSCPLQGNGRLARAPSSPAKRAP